MTDYISRLAAIEANCGGCNPAVCSTDCDAVAAIRAIPAADVRHVVTCGKCKYGKYTETEWFCDKHSGHADKFGEDASYHEYHSKHWFCADGEKRKEI